MNFKWYTIPRTILAILILSYVVPLRLATILYRAPVCNEPQHIYCVLQFLLSYSVIVSFNLYFNSIMIYILILHGTIGKNIDMKRAKRQAIPPAS